MFYVAICDEFKGLSRRCKIQTVLALLALIFHPVNNPCDLRYLRNAVFIYVDPTSFFVCSNQSGWYCLKVCR